MSAGAPAGRIAVVIDVLRASTTIVTALANGAAGVVPVADVDEARRRACGLGPGVLLGGERRGVRIAGFDLGNSPLEYSRRRVVGRTIVITTTNGTAALAACHAAREILVGALVNRTAVATAARRLAAEGGEVHLVCAGTDGLVSAEDVLGAGAILASAAAPADELDPAAEAAIATFRHAAARGDLATALIAEFRASPGGATLVGLGMETDLAAAAAIDSLEVVPRLDVATGSLV